MLSLRPSFLYCLQYASREPAAAAGGSHLFSPLSGTEVSHYQASNIGKDMFPTYYLVSYLHIKWDGKFCALTPLHCGQGLLCDIFAHPLLLGLSIYYILILYFPCHHPGIRHHPSKLWFLFIREWYLETKVCFLLLRHHCFHTPSPNREEENYTNTHLKKKKD